MTLRYTHRTLFALHIDAVWVQQLAKQGDLAEKVEAFVSRFGRLQDHLGEKLIPRFAALFGESPKSLLTAKESAEMLFQCVDSIDAQANAIGLTKLSP